MKNILEREGISYQEELNQLKNSINTETFETNQGSRIVFPNEITKDMANRFFARFWGRTDVYAKRVENKKTNKAGYYPQCINFWSDGCGKKWNAGFRCQDCHYQKYKALTIDSIKSHLKGNEIIGVYPLHKDNTCRFLVFDFDNHDKDAGNDFANIDDSWKEEVNAMREICQLNGIDPLIEHDNGILLAATAFGKTVLCADLIATKKVNTLILLESSSLLEQWKDKLQKFLDINEELPEYTTPKGLIKKRKSLIGTLQGSHDSMTGIIDIAMAGSICKKGKFHKLLNEYGMIIVDECHHAASNTESAVLKEIKAKYVYGVTAVDRTDQLDKMNFMLIGPIRHKYSAKEQAKQQGIPRLLYPRFTHVVAPRGIMKDEKNPNEAYSILRDNDLRDQMTVQDIKDCIQKNRTPVVLSKYVNHCKKLYQQLEGVADFVFLLIGSQSKKENNRIIELMKSVPEDKTMILIATGSLVGEGFDLDRLDTLFLAMPVASSSVIEQFTGRIHRLYDKKDTILVYDYVDVHIPMFDRMYGKRLKAYKKSGYELISDTNGIKSESQISQSIFDASNYYDMYSQDLLCANKNIIVSSPSLSGDRVVEFTKLIKEKMESGVEVTIVSWMPDKIRFGSSNYRMQLLEEMRQSGFYLKSAEDNCEHFAIIDQEIVWYGNINLLGKQDVEDHIMRIQSKEIASELMEMTFGNSLYNYLNNF